jgi:hypothetical protein
MGTGWPKCVTLFWISVVERLSRIGSAGAVPLVGRVVCSAAELQRASIAGLSKNDW